MGQAASGAIGGANDHLSMSGETRKRMQRLEVVVLNYYDDMGPGKGNCTWGAVSWRIAGLAQRRN